LSIPGQFLVPLARRRTIHKVWFQRYLAAVRVPARRKRPHHVSGRRRRVVPLLQTLGIRDPRGLVNSNPFHRIAPVRRQGPPPSGSPSDLDALEYWPSIRPPSPPGGPRRTSARRPSIFSSVFTFADSWSALTLSNASAQSPPCTGTPSPRSPPQAVAQPGRTQPREDERMEYDSRFRDPCAEPRHRGTHRLLRRGRERQCAHRLRGYQRSTFTVSTLYGVMSTPFTHQPGGRRLLPRSPPPAFISNHIVLARTAAAVRGPRVREIAPTARHPRPVLVHFSALRARAAPANRAHLHPDPAVLPQEPARAQPVRGMRSHSRALPSSPPSSAACRQLRASPTAQIVSVRSCRMSAAVRGDGQASCVLLALGGLPSTESRVHCARVPSATTLSYRPIQPAWSCARDKHPEPQPSMSPLDYLRLRLRRLPRAARLARKRSGENLSYTCSLIGQIETAAMPYP